MVLGADAGLAKLYPATNSNELSRRDSSSTTRRFTGALARLRAAFTVSGLGSSVTVGFCAYRGA